MRLPWMRSASPPQAVPRANEAAKQTTRQSIFQFLRWVGPALMVSIAYMDPGNYGTDIQGGFYGYDLIWAIWLASAMAMLLQYLSGKLGIASGRDLPSLVRESLGGRKRYVIPYWLAAEAAAAATDLAEYLGTVIALNIIFGVPLLLAAVFGALDVILLLLLMDRRFQVIEQYFVLLIGILVAGIFYNLIAVRPDPFQIATHSVLPLVPTSDAFLIVVGMIGATVMPHALFVHSWLSKNKMDLIGRRPQGAEDTRGASFVGLAALGKGAAQGPGHSFDLRKATNRLHRNETLIALTLAGIVNAGILLVAIPLFQEGAPENLTIKTFVAGMSSIYGPAIGILFALTLLASGLSSSALGTIAGQIIMEGLIGKHWNVWARRIVTRFVNVFPTTVAILLGLSPLVLLVYSQVVLSLMIPLPMIPLVYYTSKRKFMGGLVNRNRTMVLALGVVVLILAFNGYLLLVGL